MYIASQLKVVISYFPGQVSIHSNYENEAILKVNFNVEAPYWDSESSAYTSCQNECLITGDKL